MNQQNSLKWFSKDIHEDAPKIRKLSLSEQNAVTQALSLLANQNISSNDDSVKNILFSGLHYLFDEIMHSLIHQRGFITLKGFPNYQDEYNIELIKKFLLAFCFHLGTPLRQNKKHELIFDVKSIEGMTMNLQDSRGPYVKESLPMHTDAGAILGMYCFASADVGGHTLLSSSQTVHDEIRKERPDLLEVLYQPFYTDRRGNEAEGTLPYDHNPVFAMYGNELRCQYHEPFYSDSQKKFPELPRFTSQQIEAMKFFDATALRKDIVVETKLEPGDIIFINNEQILHGRTSFDNPKNQTIRHLLRIWLNTPKIRHTFPNFLGYID